MKNEKYVLLSREARENERMGECEKGRVGESLIFSAPAHRTLGLWIRAKDVGLGFGFGLAFGLGCGIRTGIGSDSGLGWCLDLGIRRAFALAVGPTSKNISPFVSGTCKDFLIFLVLFTFARECVAALK